jgi:hypothetical protein
MICHRSSAALIDRPDQLHDLVGFDFTGEAIAPERVGNLVEAFSVSFQDGLPAAFSTDLVLRCTQAIPVAI